MFFFALLLMNSYLVVVNTELNSCPMNIYVIIVTIERERIFNISSIFIHLNREKKYRPHNKKKKQK